jgi:hypothetical protein
MLNWKTGTPCSIDIPGVSEDIWHQNDDLVIFPVTLK